MEKSGKELMSEMAHTIVFLDNLGYKTDTLTLDQTVNIMRTLEDTLQEGLMLKQINPIKDAFQ